jgi:hypothetical protein
MVEACSTQESEAKCVQVLIRNRKDEAHLEDIGR